MKFIFYTHSDYCDVWPLMLGQANKYLEDYPKVVFTNKGDNICTDGWDVVYYDESLPYQQRVLSCLEKLDDDIVVFSHEDMFLYEEPDYAALARFEKIAKENNIFIKLLRGGYVDELQQSDLDRDLVVAPPEMIFTIQPTICQRKHLMTMYRETPGVSIWSFEANTVKTSNNHLFTGAMAFQPGDRKRGMYHYDSCIYPYIATAVSKGKWMTSCYPELSALLRKYNIDKNLRGEV